MDIKVLRVDTRDCATGLTRYQQHDADENEHDNYNDPRLAHQDLAAGGAPPRFFDREPPSPTWTPTEVLGDLSG